MRLFLVGAALALAACNPSAQPGAEAPVAEVANVSGPNNCPATASTQWRAGGQTITIDASAQGADCASAQASLVFRGANGAELYAETFEVSQVMVLAAPDSVDDLQRRLNEWISPPGAARDSTDDLPVWEANAQSPVSGEFPFYPEEGLDRAAYTALRAADAPMFCFVQGMESEACLTVQGGSLRKVGVQTFPG
ncbi:hypothetical protein U91I_01662 [alpha proteobacterium U9-1i]|nr:hypothetical protein U91I_01662 [alpha proteobacterium U9-1i]